MLRQASGALRRAVASRRQASTLIIADHDGANMTPSTLAALTAAGKLEEKSAVLVAGAPAAVAEQAARRAELRRAWRTKAQNGFRGPRRSCFRDNPHLQLINPPS